MTQIMTDIAARVPDPLARLKARQAAIAGRRDRFTRAFDRPRQQVATDRRQFPRLTLDELEALSEDKLAEQFKNVKKDGRSGITRFFDILDLPRNVIGNTLIRPLLDKTKVKRKIREGNKGTFGLPRITFSDLLGQAGVDPSLGRSVAGFVGDVAMDPLTFLSFGAGTGAKVSVKAGTIGLKKAANKQLTSALGDIAAGKAVRATGRLQGLDPVLSRLQSTAAQMRSSGFSEDIIKSRLNEIVRGRTGLSVAATERLGRRQSLNRYLAFAQRRGISREDALQRFAQLEKKGRIRQRFRTLGERTAQQIQDTGKFKTRGRVGVLGREIGKESEIGESVTGFLQREIRSRRGITIDVPFAALDKELVTFDPAVRQLRRIKTSEMGQAGQERVAELVNELAVRKTRAGLKASVGVELAEEVAERDRVRQAWMKGRRDFGHGFVTDADGKRRRVATLTPPPSLVDLRVSHPDLHHRMLIGELDLETALEAAMNRRSGMGFSTLNPDFLRSQVDEASRWLEIQGDEFDFDSGLGDILRKEFEDAGFADQFLALAEDDSLRKITNTYINQGPAAGKRQLEQLLTDTSELRFGKSVTKDIADLRTSVDEVHERMVTNVEEFRNAPVKAMMDEFDTNISVLGNKISSMTDELARVDADIAQLKIGGDATVDNRMLQLASDIHSPQGLDYSMGLSGLSRMARTLNNIGDNTQLQFLNRVADTVFSVDRSLQKFFGAGFRGTQLAGKTTAFRRFEEGARREAFELRQTMNDRITKIADTFGGEPEVQDRIKDFITAKLELGVVAQQYPDGRPLFAGVSASPESVEDLVRAQQAALEAAKGTGRPPVWDSILDKVIEGMRDHEDLWNNQLLNTTVSEMQDRYAQLLDTAIKSKALDAGLQDFSARVLNPDAASAMRLTNAGEPVKFGDPLETSLLSRFGFQRHRTTSRFVWRDAKGDLQDHFLFEIANNEQSLNAVRKAVDAGLVPKHGFQTSVFSVNDLAESGRFSNLLGGDYKGKIFDTDPAIALASNYSQIKRKQIGDKFGDWLTQFNRVVTKPDREGMIRDGILVRAGGQLADKDAQAVGQTIAFRLTQNVEGLGDAGDVVRTLNISQSSPLNKWIPDDLKNVLVDQRVATQVEEVAQAMSDPDAIGKFLKMMDVTTQAWKIQTLFHPSWVALNMTGNVIAAFMSGAKPHQMKYFGSSWRLYNQYRKLTKTGDVQGLRTLLGETTQIGDRTFRNHELFDAMYSSGVLEQGRILRHMLNVTQNLGNDPKSQSGMINWALKKRPVRAFFMGNHHMEQTQRMFTFMTRVANGDDLAQAGQATTRYMYNYGDFSRFEDAAMRRLLPFYPWLRNNAPFIVNQLLREPKWAAAFPKLKQNLDSAFNDEERIHPMMRPGWVEDNMGAQIGKGTALLVPMFTQFQDLAEIAQAVPGIGGTDDLLEFFNWGVTQVNPLIQIPIELGAHREFFTGREIGDKDLGEVDPFEFAGREQIRLLRDAERIHGVVTDENLTVGDKVERTIARSLLAGRAQFIDQDIVQSRKIVELSVQAQKLRAQVNRAIRDGDRLRAMRLSVRLDQTWAEMLRIDPETTRVPGQVRERLQGQ